MSDTQPRRGGLGCVFSLLVVAAFGAMVYVMMEQSGDLPFRATAPVTIHGAPDEGTPAIGTLEAGSALMCHGLVAGDSRWLDCSDMLEDKYLRAASMRQIDEDAFDTLRRSEQEARRKRP